MKRLHIDDLFVPLAAIAIIIVFGASKAKEIKEQGYKQGQIDCIEGRVLYQPDTNYIKIEPQTHEQH